MSISVSVNDEIKQIEQALCLADALLQWGFEAEQVAVAINTEFVPRSSYSNYLLKQDDCVDVLAPVQGG